MANPQLINGVGSPQSIYDESSRQYHAVGTRAFLDDGRVFYYSANRQNTGITRGQILSTPAEIANHVNQSQSTSGTSVEIGASVINIDVGATACNLGDYVEGYVAVTDGLGEGFIHKIRDHAGGTSAAVSFTLYDPIQVAWAAATTVSLVPSLYVDALAAVALTNLECGVSNVSVTAGAGDESATAFNTTTYYYWMQTWGPAVVLVDASTTGATRGTNVGRRADTAGAMGGLAAGRADGATAQYFSGELFSAAVDGEHQPVYLRIAP